MTTGLFAEDAWALGRRLIAHGGVRYDRWSNFDGQQGGWISCEGGAWFALDDPNAFGGRRQLQC